jgi:hypothetical protein
VDLSGVESELSALREGMNDLAAEVRALRQSQQAAGIRAPIADEARAGAEEASSEAPASDLPIYVAQVLAEERKLQEAERERQREERRVRMEERRKELEAMREGPYDRYNVKVNSLGKVLNLTDAQKRSYYELVTAYNGKLEESLRQARAERAAAAAGGESEPPRGPGRGPGGTQFRELYEGLQKSFSADVTALLSTEQARTYGELSRSAQGFQGTDIVAAPGEGGGGPGGGGFPGRGGVGPGGPPAPGGGPRRGR